MHQAKTNTRRWMRGPSASLRGALLGLLIERPGHGGDLANRLKTHLGETWRIDSNDVYRLLEQLENDGLIECRVEPHKAGHRQPQVIYYPTADAPNAVALWMETLLPREPVRLGLQAKIAVAREQDIPSVLRALKEYERECLQLAQLISVMDTEVRSWKTLCVDCTRDAIRAQLRAEIDWAARTRQRINEFIAQE